MILYSDNVAVQIICEFCNPGANRSVQGIADLGPLITAETHKGSIICVEFYCTTSKAFILTFVKESMNAYYFLNFNNYNTKY